MINTALCGKLFMKDNQSCMPYWLAQQTLNVLHQLLPPKLQIWPDVQTFSQETDEGTAAEVTEASAPPPDASASDQPAAESPAPVQPAAAESPASVQPAAEAPVAVEVLQPEVQVPAQVCFLSIDRP